MASDIVASSTDPVFYAWLQDDSAVRCILIETTVYMGGVDVPVYLSSKDYITGPAEATPNLEYLPIIQGGVKITEQFSVDGSNVMSYGTVELDNKDGSLDYWLDGVWANREMKVLFGDVSWPRANFRRVFRGVFEDIDSSGRDRLNLKLRDRLQLLNTPVSETVLGGQSSNKAQLRPVLMGEAFGFEPLLVDAGNHEYQFHFGASERLIEVRDDGVPVSFTATLSAGTFRLNQTPKGTITVSAQGDNNGGYASTIAGIVKKLVKNYGRADTRYTDADIDLASFTSFDQLCPAPVGIPLTDKANVLETCQKLAASLGAVLMTSRDGLAQLAQLNPAKGLADAVVVTEDDMVNATLKLVERKKVEGSVRLGFCECYSPQADLQSGIVESHLPLFELDWLTTTQNDPAVISTYRLHNVPEQENTYLLDEADAVSEALRRLSIKKVPRSIYQYTGFAESLQLKLGNEMFIKHHRYGLSGGKYGVIVGLEPDWLSRRCVVKVMI